MSNGRHLLILPIVYAVILPALVFVMEISIIPKFFSHALLILAGIFIFWNLIEFFRIFSQHKGNAKKFENAIQSKQIIKLFLIGSAIFTAGELMLEYKTYNALISEDTLEKYDAKAFVFFKLKTTFLTSLVYSLVPLIIVIMFPNYSYGHTYAFFQIGLSHSKKIEKIWAYQKALEAYNHYLAETLGVKLKHLQEIESKIISEDINSVDEKIKTLFLNHNDKLKPIIELSKWVKIDNENIFQTNNFWENSEKWSKFVPVISATFTAGVLIFLHYNPPNIP